MSLKEAKRQKKLAKKRAKDKRRHQLINAKKQALISTHGRVLSVSQGEIVGCWRCDPQDDLPKLDMATPLVPVIIVRKASNGLMGFINFLVDPGCLGVKDCVIHVETPDRIEELMERVRDRMPLTPVDPSVGRAIVEAGVDYAAQLGLGPHADYAVAKLIWGDVAVGEFPADLELGRNGKPFYFAGPFENAARQAYVMNCLNTSVGEGNYEFIAGGF